MTDFGSDLACLGDLDELVREVDGPTALAQNLARRLETPRGGVIDAPDYGLDVRAYLSRGLTPEMLAAIPGEVRAELQKDERVEAVDVRVEPGSEGASMALRLNVSTGEGPFAFTLDVTAAAVLLGGVS